MPVLGEIRLHRVGMKTGKIVVFESQLISGERGSYRMELPAYAVPAECECIDVRVAAWELETGEVKEVK